MRMMACETFRAHDFLTEPIHMIFFGLVRFWGRLVAACRASGFLEENSWFFLASRVWKPFSGVLTCSDFKNLRFEVLFMHIAVRKARAADLGLAHVMLVRWVRNIYVFRPSRFHHGFLEFAVV